MSSSARPFIIGVLGAESTGKTTLCEELAQALTRCELPKVGRSRTPRSSPLSEATPAHPAVSGTMRRRPRVTVVSEYLREFCTTHGRTPREEEQAAIAAEQTRRIEAARDSGESGIIIADTTAVMIAVYSDYIFGDPSLYPRALSDHRDLCDLTLLTALDLPWQGDGLQRDGPHVREPVDALIRDALTRGGIGWSSIFGQGQARTRNAAAIVGHAQARAASCTSEPLERQDTAATTDTQARWTTRCECCGDPDCERRLLALGRARRG